ERLAKETEFAAGYERVRTPHLARENMYLTSGHLPYYADSMFPPMLLPEEHGKSLQQQEREKVRELVGEGGALDDGRIDTLLDEFEKMVSERPHDRYYLKAMNCPHHHKIFA